MELAMIENWMYTREELRMESIFVVPRIISEQIFGQKGRNILSLTTSLRGLNSWSFGRSSNDVIGEKSKENSVLRPTKVATNEVVEFEIVRSVEGSQQSDCLPADIDMRSTL